MTTLEQKQDQFGNLLSDRDYLGYGVSVHRTDIGEYRLSNWRQSEETRTQDTDTTILHEHCIYMTDDEIDALIRYRDRLRTEKGS